MSTPEETRPSGDETALPSAEADRPVTEAATGGGHPGWLPMLLVTPLGWFADQASKFWAVKRLTHLMTDGPTTLGAQLSLWWNERHLSRMAVSHHETTPVIDGFWSWRYAENPGAAWSFAATWPLEVRRLFFPLVSIVAVVMILHYYRRLLAAQRMLAWALSFVMAGALGNFTDRLLRGYVIDFIDWHANDHAWLRPSAHFPTFNVADVCINVGVGLIILDSLLGWLAARRNRAAPV